MRCRGKCRRESEGSLEQVGTLKGGWGKKRGKKQRFEEICAKEEMVSAGE